MKTNSYKKIVVLTGAGVSAESGLSTFRDNDGLWDKHRIEDVATPEAFDRNPELVHRFYNQRRASLTTVTPNKAHLSLATVADEFDTFLLVTQNVDDLHERAGSLNVLHMHGSLLEKTCVQCHQVSSIRTEINVGSRCKNCDELASLRPNIVWFGEMPFFMDEITTALMDCDLFVAIGTSGSVYPAAGFVEIANQAGAETVELNVAPSDQQSKFKLTKYGVATKIVPEFFNNLS